MGVRTLLEQGTRTVTLSRWARISSRERDTVPLSGIPKPQGLRLERHPSSPPLCKKTLQETISVRKDFHALPTNPCRMGIRLRS